MYSLTDHLIGEKDYCFGNAGNDIEEGAFLLFLPQFIGTNFIIDLMLIFIKYIRGFIDLVMPKIQIAH